MSNQNNKTNFDNTNHGTKDTKVKCRKKTQDKLQQHKPLNNKQIQQNARPSQRQQHRKQSDKTVQLYQIKIHNVRSH